MPVTNEHNSLVSIIIPNYNHARFVGDAINSVLIQDYKNIEVIVVDDGSTDNSREVISEFGSQVKYIYQKNSGLSAARNTGIRASRGVFIGVLDADDIYEPAFINTLVGSLEANPDADGVYCGYQFVDQDNNLLPQIENRLVPSDELYATLLDGNFFVPESVFLRRYVYDQVDPFDEVLRACEDWDVWLRVTKTYRIIHSPNILTRHRILKGSMSTDPLRMLTARLAVLKKHLGEEPLVGGSSIVHRAYGRAYLSSCVEYLQFGNEARAYECFQKMARICPELLIEIDTYYQLGCGNQPKGYMGDLTSLDINRSSPHLHRMMKQLFADIRSNNDVKCFEQVALAKMSFVLGLLSYGTKEFRMAKQFFFRALMEDPRLIFNRQLVEVWSKSLAGSKLINHLKRFRNNSSALSYFSNGELNE